MSQNDNVDILASDAAYALIPILEQNLRLAADAGGWPDEIIKELSVKFDEGSLSVAWPENLEQTIQDLEYGSKGNSQPVLRGFIYRADSHIKSVLANQTVDLLMQYEEVF